MQTKNKPTPDYALPSEDSTCNICDDSEGENSNAIVFCDGCNLAVHQGARLCRFGLLTPLTLFSRLLRRSIHSRRSMALQKVRCIPRGSCCEYTLAIFGVRVIC